LGGYIVESDNRERIDNGGGPVFLQLTEELLDLTVSVKGRQAGAFAMVIACCCSSCCCMKSGGD
jgi:hypothetical protein